ncbi:MAG: CDP-alcohol phosphatidyltransferase family protein [Candidatus Thorarchaeota archaeon]
MKIDDNLPKSKDKTKKCLDMTEKFKKFKQICQGEKLAKQKRKKDWWHAGPRLISIYITWILVKTPVTANFVSIFGILIGLAGLYLIFLGTNFTIFLGFILLYLHHISDEIDGEVARYKRQTSVRGIYYDEISHLLIHGMLFLTFGFSVYKRTDDILYVILGFLGSFFLLGIRIIRKIPIIATSKSAVYNIVNFKDNSSQKTEIKKGGLKIIKAIIMNLVNAFSHTMLIITMFFIGYILYINFNVLWILELLIKLYVVFILIVFIFYMITKFKSLETDVVKVYNKIVQ